MTSEGVVAIIAAIGVLITTIFTAWANLKAKTEHIRDINEAQSRKLDNITILVDGRFGELLQKMADVSRLLALTTGDSGDASRAVAAQEAATAQHGRTADATAAIAKGGSVKLPEDSQRADSEK